MGKVWRVGLVGLGSAALKIHLPALKKLKQVEVVGGADVTSPAQALSFPVFDSCEEMLASTKPDIVAIITPPVSHFEIARTCLKAGVHVFCEKPFVETVAEAEQLIALAAASKLRIVVNQEFRYMQAHQAAMEMIGTDEFGDLNFIAINQTFRTSAETETGWRGESQRRTCYEFGTHALDLCRYFYREDPISITALMPKPTGADGPDLLNLIQLEFSSDRYAAITLDRLTRGPHRYLDIRLNGTHAGIETTVGGLVEFAAGVRGGGAGPFVRLERRASASARLYKGEAGRTIASDPMDVFPSATAKLFETMLDALETGELPPCSAEDNITTLKLMLAAYESARQGGAKIALAGSDG